jgi:predicted membrane-bound mannosyltransferase
MGGLEPQVLLAELPIAALGAAGGYLARRQPSGLVLAAAAWATTAILLLATQRPLWPHHALVLIVPLALLAAGTASRLDRLRPESYPLAVGVLLLGFAVSALHVHTYQTPDDSRRDAVAAQLMATGPGDPIITDDQYTVALAGRSTPPTLVDTSQVRVQSGELSTTQVAATADRSNAPCVLVDEHYGSLNRMPGFRRWVTHRYGVRHRLGHGRVLYLRAAQGSGDGFVEQDGRRGSRLRALEGDP